MEEDIGLTGLHRPSRVTLTCKLPLSKLMDEHEAKAEAFEIDPRYLRGSLLQIKKFFKSDVQLVDVYYDKRNRVYLECWPVFMVIQGFKPCPE